MVLPPRGHSYYNGRERASRMPEASVPADLDRISPISRTSLSPEIDLGDSSFDLDSPPNASPPLRRTTRVELPRLASITDAPLLTRMPGVVLTAQSASDLSRRSRSRSRGRRSPSRSRSRSSGRSRSRRGGRRSRRN